MFIPLTIKDNVRVAPADLSLPRAESITNELNKKYANKVLHDKGLCLAVIDLLEVSDGVVQPCQDGSYMARVFRPFVGELLIGKVSTSTPNGIRVSMEFFDDIIIPSNLMKEESAYDTKEALWVWTPGGSLEDSDDDTSKFYFDKGERIRVRVDEFFFEDVGPIKSRDPNHAEKEGSDNQVPFQILVSVAEPGLGLLTWW